MLKNIIYTLYTDRTYTCNTAGMMPCLNETKCIPSEWWCDGMVDCMEDQTDESSCGEEILSKQKILNTY